MIECAHHMHNDVIQRLFKLGHSNCFFGKYIGVSKPVYDQAFFIKEALIQVTKKLTASVTSCMLVTRSWVSLSDQLTESQAHVYIQYNLGNRKRSLCHLTIIINFQNEKRSPKVNRHNPDFPTTVKGPNAGSGRE